MKGPIIAALALMRAAQCFGAEPEKGDRLKPAIYYLASDVRKSVSEKREFTFQIAGPHDLDGQALTTEFEETGLEITPSSASTGQEFTAKLRRSLNLARITVNLFRVVAGTKERVGQSTEVLDLTFSVEDGAKLEVEWRVPLTKEGTLETGVAITQSLLLRRSGTTTRVMPSFPVSAQISTGDGCAEFRPISDGPPTKFTNRPISVTFPQDRFESTAFEFQPSLYTSKTCEVQVRLSVLDKDIQFYTYEFKPTVSYLPAAAACLFGALIAYVFSALVGLVADRSRGSKASRWRAAFLGAKGLEPVAVLLRACVAFGGFALLLHDSKVLGIAVDTQSLRGFVSLGFMIGLWPIDRIVEVLKQLVPPMNAPPTSEGNAQPGGG